MNDLVYIEVEKMQLLPEDGSIVLQARWTGLVDPIPDDYPVYINFQANPMQLRNAATTFTTRQVTSNIETFFDKFTYTMNRDVDGNLMLLAHAKP